MEANMNPQVAYFTMEIAIDPTIPTYSGGLGVLAGDMVRTAADMKLPLIGVTLLHRHGYFSQRIDANGWQTEQPVDWRVERHLRPLGTTVSVTIEGREVHVGGWQYDVRGVSGYSVSVLFLDTDDPRNSDWDRQITSHLYGGDLHYRLCQEVVLGIGGVRLLRALGYQDIARFHMNEGHAAFLVVELLAEEARRTNRPLFAAEDIATVRRKCVFTTHTPVPAGHDHFPLDMAGKVLGHRELLSAKDVFCCDNELNMTYLGFNLSHFINGVAKKHQEVAHKLFANYSIDAITNGVHAGTWVARDFQSIYDKYIPGWREDNTSLRNALAIPRHEIWSAHTQSKQALFELVRDACNVEMDESWLTIGFARRATAYKRPDLLLSDPKRLREIAARFGGIQIVYAGKAHPKDDDGKRIIQRIWNCREQLLPSVRLAYVPNYDVTKASLLTAGVDLWLNTPDPPMEASGTSGMKAALNGVPSLSVLDGWWLEGCIEGVTGWAIGTKDDPLDRARILQHADALYEKLQGEILPLYMDNRDRFVDVMKHCIALNGSYFNTQRMLQQYITKAYFG
jgi:starch phosphorylase